MKWINYQMHLNISKRDVLVEVWKEISEEHIKMKHIGKHGNYLLEEKQKTCTEIEM